MLEHIVENHAVKSSRRQFSLWIERTVDHMVELGRCLCGSGPDWFHAPDFNLPGLL